MLWVSVLCSLGGSALQRAPCLRPGLGALWVLCPGLVSGGKRGRREKGGTSPLCSIAGMFRGSGWCRCEVWV